MNIVKYSMIILFATYGLFTAACNIGNAFKHGGTEGYFFLLSLICGLMLMCTSIIIDTLNKKNKEN